MCAAKTTVLVRDDTVMRPQSFVSRSGKVRGWLEIGESGALVVIGSPVQLRRLAVAVRDAAKAAEKRSMRVDLAIDGRPAAA